MRLSTLWRPLALPLLFLVIAAPASAQYASTPIPAAFTDISVTGTAGPVGDDALSAAIPFPGGFTFTYYGTARTAFRINTNGWIDFNVGAPTAAQARANTALPATGLPNSTIAPFWDDLNVPATATAPALPGQTDYQFVAGATAAEDRLIVQWTNVVKFGVTTDNLNFQVQLFRDGRVEFHYGTMTAEGTSFTTGLENDAGASGVQIFFNPTTAPALDNTAYRIVNAPGPGVFSTTFVGLAFASAGPCVIPTAGIGQATAAPGGTFTNNGGAGSTVTIQSVTFTGPQASSFQFFSAPPTFPVTLAQGQSTAAVRLFFRPPAGATGPQNASLTVTYTVDGGATQTLNIPLSGSADTEGAGLAFRSTVADASCANGVTAPPTPTFVDITGHTQIAALSADDAVATVLLSTLPVGNSFGPSVRLFGVDHAAFQANSNGVVALGAAPALSNTNYGAFPTVGPPTILVAGTDLNLLNNAATTPVAYDPADPGQFPVGVYYGLSNVDGVGGDELVITYFHAYDYQSPVYTATANAAEYITAQLVIYKATRANEEDRLEIRFPDGNDSAGIPFRLNTAVGTSTDPALENGTSIGVTSPQGVETAIYRIGQLTAGFGGPMYSAAAPNGAVGVRFEAQAQAIADGQAGWRMMGTSVRNYTVGRLAGVNLVQSVTGQYPDYPADNLYTDYDGTSTGSGYVPAASTADVLTPGQGFIWYLFDQDITPNPANDGSGTSRSYTLPMRLEATGTEPALTAGAYSVPLVTTGGGFNLLANPYRDDLDVSTLNSLATGGTLTSAVPQVWDPNVGASGSYVTVSGRLAAWQGFFIQNNTATALNIPTNLRDTTGTFLGRAGALYSNTMTANPARLTFELSGVDAATGGTTIDRAATLVLSETGADGWDLLDASKLSPLANAYATIAFQGELNGEANLKAQESRALDAASFDVPLVVDAVGTAPSLTLAWGDLSVLPETWTLELRDVVTGETVNLRSVTSYTFDQEATAARELSPEAIVAQTTVAAQAKATDAARFVLHVTTNRTTAGEGQAIAEFALAAPAPNPTTGASRVSFDVPTAGPVSVAVYDLLGRRVAVLAQGDIAVGRHEVRLDAGALAPGVYVIRMQSGTFMATQRVTVVR